MIRKFLLAILACFLSWTNIYSQCDSVLVTMKYNEEDQTHTKRVEHYSPSGQLLWADEFIQNELNGPWENYSKLENTYDLNDRLIVNASYTWENSAWQNERKTEFAFDASGNKILAQYFSGVGILWTILEIDSSTYDIQNRLTTLLAYKSTYDTTRTIYFYNINDKIENEYVIKLNGAVWDSTTWKNYHYNVAGLLDTMTQKKYNAGWVNNNMIINVYDIQDRVVSVSELSWDGIQWRYGIRDSYTYDSNGFLNYDLREYSNYDVNDSLWFDEIGHQSYVRNSIGYLLSCEGHFTPGGPFNSNYIYENNVLIHGYTFSSTMGGMTTTNYYDYFYADLFGDSTICQGNATTLWVDSCAGNSYLWSNGETTSSITVTSGTYSAAITHLNGYTVHTPEITINVATGNPYVPVGVDSSFSLCADKILTLYAPTQLGATYQWFKNDSLFPGQTEAILSINSYGNLTDGNYYLVASNACGSDTSAQTNITLLALPPIPVVTSSTGSLDFCVGDSIVLTSSPATSYLWWPSNATTSSITVTTGGFSSLRNYSANGCYSSKSFQPRTLSTVSENANITITANVLSTTYNTTNKQWFLDGDTIPGATSSTYSPTVAGNYSLALSYNSTCVRFTNSIYVDPSVLNIYAGIDKYVCENGFVYFGNLQPAIGGLPPYSYRWNFTPNLNDYLDGTARYNNVTADKTFILTVTDSLGNTARDTVRIFVDHPVSPELITPEIGCYNGYNSVRAIVDLDQSEFSIVHWIINGDTLSSNSGSIQNTGTIQAWITDVHGCKVLSEIDTVIFHTPESINLHSTLDPDFCTNGVSTYWVNQEPGATYEWEGQYSYSPISTDTIFTATVPGQYNLTKTDSYGCIAGTYFTNIDLMDNSFSFGIQNMNPRECGSFDLLATDIAGCTYQWFLDSIPQSGNGNILSCTSSGNYFCIITTPGGCTSSQSIFIGPSAVQTATIAMVGNTFYYTGVNTGYNYYQWFLNGQEIPGAYTSSYTPVVMGYYYLRLNVGNNLCYIYSNNLLYNFCTTTIQRSTEYICQGSCNGELSSSHIGIPPFSYNWSNGSTDSVATGLCAGFYMLTVTDSVGCMAFDTLSILEDTASMHLTTTHTTCIGCTNGEINVDMTGGITPYVYSINPVVGTQSGNHFTDLSPGIYQLCAIDSNGCTFCVTDTILEDPTIVNEIKSDGIFVYPNPALNKITLHLENLSNEEYFTIENVLGQRIVFGKIVSKSTEISIENFKPGVYYLKLTGKEKKVISFVKQ